MFSDFSGGIKSLGAWGGDFILVAAHNNPTDYFSEKGFNTIIPFKDMILWVTAFTKKIEPIKIGSI